MKTLVENSSVRGGAACPQAAGSGAHERPESALRTTRPTSISAFLRFLTFTLTFTLAPLAYAQWQTTAYPLRGGWNAIYLHGDATHATLDQHFANNPEVLSVWRWNANPTQVQFGVSPLIPTSGTPEWSIWRRGLPAQTTLTNFSGPAAYLVECSGAATDTYLVQLTHKVVPPQSTWVRNGATFLGFPTRSSSGTYPTFAAYFATFPAAIAANTRIYRYAGGPLGPTNPVQVFSTSTERVDRTQAYWFEAPVVGNFYAPLEISPSDLSGLNFERTGSTFTVRVRNRTAAPVTLSVQSLVSASAPTGQDAVVAAVPLTRRTFDADTSTYVFNPVGAFNEVIGPQASVELVFGINRALLTGTVGAFYASLLRFTDSGSLLDVTLPVSARVASLAGLWVGDIAVNGVNSFAPGSPGNTTSRPFPLRVILHIDNSGTARLLSQVFMGRLAPAPYPLGLCTKESGLKPDAKASATRLVSVQLPIDTVLPTGPATDSVALGATLVRTVSVAFDASTNPFVHTYHPDHDNKDARFQAPSPESPSYTRACSFTFAPTPPAGSSPVGWGSTVLGGTYSETITGVHRNAITLSGTFELRRISDLGDITLNQ